VWRLPELPALALARARVPRATPRRGLHRGHGHGDGDDGTTTARATRARALGYKTPRMYHPSHHTPVAVRCDTFVASRLREHANAARLGVHAARDRVYETSRLVQVTSGRSYLWGTNLLGDVWYCANPCRPGSLWNNGALGSIKQMEVGDVQIYAIHNNGRTIYVQNENAIGGWSTINVPASFSSTDIVNQVAVGETSLWLLDGQGKLYQCSLPCAGGGAFTLIPSAPANIISIDAGKVVR